MTSRMPPSRRDPKRAADRAARAVASQTPGAGRVGLAAPVLPAEILALLRGRVSSSAGGGYALAVVSPDEPANPPTGLLWYDTDATC
jgi:hypothetical protein